ncbi:amidohydrolase family protein [Marinicella meishanensis]|uniref:amidohydrolase family protein n=1 Tax=Marinicella meishanensis TaxID=2873263 RepID=UPI001CC0D6F5|nr:amidohydrolase family protein [Marinicella sp. NBU2979]
MTTKLKLTAWAVLASSPWALTAQVPTETINGNLDQRDTLIALTDATIHLNPDETITQGTLLLRNGRIVGINRNNQTPADALIKDYTGMHIYPGFIHLDSSVGLPEPDARPPFSWNKAETINSTTEGAYNSNEAIKASWNAAAHYVHDDKASKELREAGFTTALSHRKDGIMRGTSVLVNLADQAEELNLVATQAAQHFAFDKGSSKQDFPVSLMGEVALIRQTWLDAEWYAQQQQMTDLDLAAINANRALPKIITVSNWQETLLADKIGDEFNTQFVVRTAADSYRNLDAIQASGQTLIVPLSIPDAPAISDELDAWNVSYQDLKAWEVAPHNPALLQQAGITFALLPDPGKKGLGNFLKDLRNAHRHGLDEATALRALTTVPAAILGQSDLGTLASGHWANFVVTSGPLLEAETYVAETWVAGHNHPVNGLPSLLPGAYQLSHDDQSMGIHLHDDKGKLKLTLADEDSEVKIKVKQTGQFVTLTISQDDSDHELFGVINNRQLVAIAPQEWTLQRQGDLPASDDSDESDSNDAELPQIPQPFTAYGLATASTADDILVQNATVWTNADDGILANTDVWVQGGQIKAIGQNLSAPKDALVVDGSDMHLTSGIIDEHAHIALLAVNDIAVNSSMVRMADALNPHDVNIYRNLAGGVTAAQLLHGSANPIGGQSALIKMRWGVDRPEDMLIEGADGFIKFALGENVKRSRNAQSIRYPLTRMGVEQVYRDAFTQAKAYEQAWADYHALSRRAKQNATPPRRDLALEATLEVINQELFVSCHSYVQSEINMLMHVADDFGFNINTFTHILEGYKVADKMQQHGVGGSTFSDWWAYKWEVNYAIPYNAALMHNAGVVTAINSDSGEMSRRLNQEAAKSVKYGDLSEQDAWKLVTLNPAKLLHLDDRMGSIEVGKDADMVLWSDHPLSIYARAEKTMVDGVIYYDRSQQAALEAQIAEEKSRLIEASQNSKGKKSKRRSAPPQLLHCDTITGDHATDHELYHGAAQ